MFSEILVQRYRQTGGLQSSSPRQTSSAIVDTFHAAIVDRSRSACKQNVDVPAWDSNKAFRSAPNFSARDRFTVCKVSNLKHQGGNYSLCPRKLWDLGIRSALSPSLVCIQPSWKRQVLEIWRSRAHFDLNICPSVSIASHHNITAGLPTYQQASRSTEAAKKGT